MLQFIKCFKRKTIRHLGRYFYKFSTKVKQKQDNKDEAQMMIRPLTDGDYDGDA